MSKEGQYYIDVKEAAGRSGLSVRRINQMIRGGQVIARRMRGKNYIDQRCDKRFLGVKTAGQVSGVDELQSVAAHKREAALKRLGWIKEAEKFAAAQERAGATRTVALKMFCELHAEFGKRSLDRWLQNYRDRGLMGLVDSRGGGAEYESISPEAWRQFEALYLDREVKKTIKLCWQMVNQLSRAEGHNWQIPSLRVMHNLVERDIPMPVRVLHREGHTAYEAKCAPYVLIDYESVEPGSIWVGDHHQFNFWIRHRHKWIRPWLTAWQDFRSRRLVGWDINASPNQTTILLAAKRAMERYGPPEAVKIDNGKDYDSEMWTGMTKRQRRVLNKGYLDEKLIAGIYAMLDILASFAIPYNAKGKNIERTFDTIDLQFSKTIPTYCGKDVSRRPEPLEALL